MSDRTVNDFNHIASVYDTLASLVFGKNLTQSQHHFLHVIPESATVLIVGGGSGELLQTLLREKPHCRVVYVDASEKMIGLARQRVQNSPRVTFLCGTEEVQMPLRAFTVIITNFYLDLFTQQSLCRITARLRSLLAPEGLWLVTDFVRPKRRWQKLLLKTMYLFFRIVSNIEASNISDWEEMVRSTGLFCQAKELFYKGMIQGVVFRDAISPLHSPADSGRHR
ncbi:class I SAM-dependent methyltransferase [Dawidia soli]|uniref:Class I SAM-dependent methyltransferase n=1 Tax=Dawidia soli TaxID=2782352 RepID=A0AAP2D4Z7_9BACT|nr:class I SAM-dependent methyltransferase [Dawidia soli]MBT1685413.1 class I SAM-dependent methyltransferase [Dawidia soli]